MLGAGLVDEGQLLWESPRVDFLYNIPNIGWIIDQGKQKKRNMETQVVDAPHWGIGDI